LREIGSCLESLGLVCEPQLVQEQLGRGPQRLARRRSRKRNSISQRKRFVHPGLPWCLPPRLPERIRDLPGEERVLAVEVVHASALGHLGPGLVHVDQVLASGGLGLAEQRVELGRQLGQGPVEWIGRVERVGEGGEELWKLVRGRQPARGPK